MLDNLPEKEYTLEELLNLINFYVGALEACHWQMLLFPKEQTQIFKDMEDYANKYINCIDKYLKTYEKYKKENVLVSLTYTRYYKELKAHKDRGYIIPEE